MARNSTAHFDNVRTQFIINNWTDAKKPDVNLLNCAYSLLQEGGEGRGVPIGWFREGGM